MIDISHTIININIITKINILYSELIIRTASKLYLFSSTFIIILTRIALTTNKSILFRDKFYVLDLKI